MRTILAGVPLLLVAVTLSGCSNRPTEQSNDAQVVVLAPGMH